MWYRQSLIIKISSKKPKQNHHQTLSSNFVKQNKGRGPKMYNLIFCYIIVTLASCTDIGYLTLSSRIETCDLFFQQISLKDYPEAINLKNWVNLSSCTNASGTLWSQNREDMGKGESANNFPISMYCWRRPKSATSALSLGKPYYHPPYGVFSPSEHSAQRSWLDRKGAWGNGGPSPTTCRSSHLDLGLRKHSGDMMLCVYSQFWLCVECSPVNKRAKPMHRHLGMPRMLWFGKVRARNPGESK